MSNCSCHQFWGSSLTSVTTFLCSWVVAVLFSESNSFSAAKLFLLIRWCGMVPTNYVLQSISEAQAKLWFSAAV